MAENAECKNGSRGAVTQVPFEVSRVFKVSHDMAARLHPDGWHLNDLEGGDIFFDKKGVPCLAAEKKILCGKDIPSSRTDNRDSKFSRIHGTFFQYQPDHPSDLYIKPLSDSGREDVSAPYIKISGMRAENGKSNSLDVEIVSRDAKTKGGSLHLSKGRT